MSPANLRDAGGRRKAVPLGPLGLGVPLTERQGAVLSWYGDPYTGGQLGPLFRGSLQLYPNVTRRQAAPKPESWAIIGENSISQKYDARATALFKAARTSPPSVRKSIQLHSVFKLPTKTNKNSSPTVHSRLLIVNIPVPLERGLKVPGT